MVHVVCRAHVKALRYDALVSDDASIFLIYFCRGCVEQVPTTFAFNILIKVGTKNSF